MTTMYEGGGIHKLNINGRELLLSEEELSEIHDYGFNNDFKGYTRQELEEKVESLDNDNRELHDELYGLKRLIKNIQKDIKNEGF